jgi:hypothetical protein
MSLSRGPLFEGTILSSSWQNGGHHMDVRALVTAADIIGCTDRPALYHEGKRVHRILGPSLQAYSEIRGKLSSTTSGRRTSLKP